MIKKNIKLAEKLLAPVLDQCETAYVMGSSVYGSKENVDIDVFLVVNPEKLQKLDEYIAPLSKNVNHKNNVEFFARGKSNFTSYYLIYEDTEFDLVVMSESLFDSVTGKLDDHFAVSLKQVVGKTSSKKYALFGLDGSRIENTYSSFDEKLEANRFPINLTINDMYYGFLPLSNILGASYILKGKEKYETSTKNLTKLLVEKYGSNPDCKVENLVV